MRKLKPHGRNDPHIFDYSKITDKIYIGSDLCKGRDCLEHSAEFKSLGADLEYVDDATFNKLDERYESLEMRINKYITSLKKNKK